MPGWMAVVTALIIQTQGTPYVPGGNTPAGTDCSGLASWVANAATGRPIFGNRFGTHNEAAALTERGFRPGTAPNSLVIGWNDHHTAVTLPDGTNVASGERGGVTVGGGGAYQPQFDHRMYLPLSDLPNPPDPPEQEPQNLPPGPAEPEA